MRTTALALGAMLASFSTAAADVANGDVNDPYGYTANVQHARLAALQAMGQAKGAKGRLGAAGYYRVRGELDNSSRAARQCLEGVASEPADSVKGVAYLCSATLAGNALLQGDIAGWARQMQDVRTRLDSDILPMLKDAPHTVRVASVSEPTFDRFLQWPRSAEPIAAPAADVSVPIQLQNELPTITLKVKTAAGERDLRVHVDTGAARSQIGRTLAAELGLALTEGFAVADANGDALYALAAPMDLDIGGLAVHQVSFVVLGQDDLPRIGLDVLRALGRVRIDKDALVVQAASSKVPCTRRMATVSSLTGDDYQLRYPIRAGKDSVLVQLDTGFNGAFMASGIPPTAPPPAAVQRRNIITTDGARDLRYAGATTPVMIGDEVLNLPVDLALEPGRLFNPDWQAGFATTQRYSLYLDVAGTFGCPVPVPQAAPLLPPRGS
ncbi:retroviral-like aspartic protease family protein [Stenotrophomonas sp. S48]|uniref:retroviral-like aspartic protease family protein n=1 Tax=unclassified Stenotrophomonas TaxID=196198 RepID=UPI00190180E5|nr:MULTISPECIES: retroviral-like aspartic protease family protein [unclassified Stenotrophomonas]MBK0027335.1 retroviral-like aspartic protease family protein [Stenotrophomonas sp. S48]MBK0049436.1 retroviral-like aspartic protease family protein [Stenotrophomonas sp. S49]